jgi:hypothetical protein
MTNAYKHEFKAAVERYHNAVIKHEDIKRGKVTTISDSIIEDGKINWKKSQPIKKVIEG